MTFELGVIKERVFFNSGNFYYVGCLWHTTVKIQSGLFFIIRTNCKASQQDCLKSLSIISSSKPTNGIVQNLYRILIDLLPLKNVEMPNLLPFGFPTRGLGWLVNQRNPSGYWQVTEGNVGQIISSLQDFFLFRSSFFLRFQQRLVGGRDFGYFIRCGYMAGNRSRFSKH